MKSSRDHSLIPLAEPVLSGNEKKYVEECLDSGWISGSGKFVSAFEQEFAHFCGAKHAITVSNGTIGLHLALLAFQIGLGDEVLVPDLTYIATANAVVYCGATPVLVDIDPVTWTMDVLDAKRKITSRTRAILPVHLYGHPANMRALNALAKEHG